MKFSFLFNLICSEPNNASYIFSITTSPNRPHRVDKNIFVILLCHGCSCGFKVSFGSKPAFYLLTDMRACQPALLSFLPGAIMPSMVTQQTKVSVYVYSHMTISKTICSARNRRCCLVSGSTLKNSVR